MLRRIGIVLTIAGIVFFVLSFLRIITGHVPSECNGSECLAGESRWLLVLPGSIFAFVGGILLWSFGGRGYGTTSGPTSFGQVDTGDWNPERRASPAGQSRAVPRWSRSWRNIYLYTGVGEVGLAILFVIGAVSQPKGASGLGLTAGILGGIGIVFLFIGGRAAAKDRLHVTGLEGRATILGFEQTGMWMNANPYVKLDLRIEVPGHPAYEVKHTEIVPAVLVGRLTNGEALPVKVDPHRPSHFVVDWEHA